MSHALLIDGENVSSRHAARILAEIPSDCAVRRVYGDVSRLNGWTKVPELAVHHVPPGKNATDMAISIHATALAHGQAIAGFTIVTRDADYSAVVRHLRESGRRVTVISEGMAPERLRAAAHSCIELPTAPPPDAAVVTKAADPQPTVAKEPPQSKLEAFVVTLIVATMGAGLPLVSVNAAAHKSLGIHIGSLSEKTWHKWFSARPALFRTDPRGPNARVRLATPPTP